MSTCLNAAQRVMAQWDALHPFNVFVAVTICTDLAPDAVRTAIADVLDDASRWTLLQIDADAASAATTLLNRRIAPDAPASFVLFNGEGGTGLGLCVPHDRADGVAAFSTLIRVVTRLLGTAAPTALPSCVGPPVPTRRVVRGLLPPQRWPRAIASIGREFLSFAACHRPAAGDAFQQETRVVSVSLPSGLLARLRVRAAARNATVNDVFAATLLDAAASVTRRQRRESRRRSLAVALPVDLRAMAPALRNARGVYISYLNVIIDEDEARFEDLIDGVRAQTAAARLTRSHVRSLFELGAASVMARGFREADRPVWFSRQKPYCGVLTSPRIPASWLAPEVTRACRAWWSTVSCGPMAPLIAAVTRAGDDLTCSFALRQYGYTRTEADAIVAAFSRTLEVVGQP
jgi:hypothetical protein